MLVIIFFFLVMSIASATTFPKLSRLKKLNRSSFGSVPTDKFDEWHRLEMKHLKLMALACKVFFLAILPLYFAALIAIVDVKYRVQTTWIQDIGLTLSIILPIAYFIFAFIIAIRQSILAKQANKLKKQYAISY